MKNMFGCIVVVAGLAMTASAQGTSRLELDCSLDGVTWSHDVVVHLSSGRAADVLLRARISWVGATRAFGFTSLTWQPVIGNARPGTDFVNPFADRGNNTSGGGVDLDGSALDGPFGRIRPFASTGPIQPHFYTALAHAGGSGGAPLGNYLRIARDDITRWMGTGPTSGTSALNNFNGAGGVQSVQKAREIVGPNDPPYNPRVSDVTIVLLSLHVGGPAVGQPQVLSWGAPTTGMSRNSITGVREASWFDGPGDYSGRLKGTVEVLPASITISDQAVLHVNAAAAAGGNGFSWATAFRDLQDALDAARALSAPPQIWVAQGTYRPDRGTGDRNASFPMVSGATLLGGFAGTESEASQRNPVAHPTILTGNLGSAPRNSFRVVTAGSLADTAEIAGFTIRSAIVDEYIGAGGGVFAEASRINIADCVLTDNSGRLPYEYGGGTAAGVFAGSGSVVHLTNCRLIRNVGESEVYPLNPFGQEGGYGWGIVCDQSSLALSNCVVAENTGGNGGNGNCTAGYGWDGGNGGSGGGLFLSGNSTATVTNSVFVGNRPGSGGSGVYCNVHSGSPGSPGAGGGISVTDSTLTLTNCTLASNSSAIVGSMPGVTVRNSIVWNNTWGTQLAGGAGVEFSSLPQAYPGVGNLVGDPMFIDMAGPDRIIGTQDDGFRLAASSPCIDAADNTAVPLGVLTDLAGGPRFFDEPFTSDAGVPGGAGGPAIVDMGAFERPLICFGDYNRDGGTDGTDVQAFYADWEAGLPGADLDNDGGVDGADVEVFITHWEAGC